MVLGYQAPFGGAYKLEKGKKMNNLEKILRDYENGNCSPLFGIFYNKDGVFDCDDCRARGVCLDFEGGCAETRARWLSMEYVEPDSLEKIAADAKERFIEYWGCQDFCCQDCPATIDGETPDKSFGVGDCVKAQACDILRRLRALDAF